MKKLQPNQIAGAAAGWKSQVIEMTQVVLNRRSVSAQLWGRWPTMRSQFLIPLFIVGTFGLLGCQSGVTNVPVSPNSETGQAIRRMDYMAAHGGIEPEKEPDYRAKAMEFIRYAQAGDVQQMLAITSPLSFATDSDSSVHTIYAEQVVPQFQGAVVTWDLRSALVTDEQKNAGLMFTGTARGKKTFFFDVAVYKENDKLVVANIRKHH